MIKILWSALATAVLLFGNSIQELSKGTEVEKLYKKLDYKPLWHGTFGLTRDASRVLDILKEDTYYGWCGETHNFDLVQDAAQADIALSQLYLQYHKNLAYGCIDWKGFDKKLKRLKATKKVKGAEWERYPYKGDITALILKHKESLPDSLKSVVPNYYGYMRLVQEAKALEAEGDIPHPEVVITKALKVGDSSVEVKALKETLKAYGYLDDVNLSDIGYDQNLSNAVKAFQKKAGIKVDGVAGKQTAGFLNAPNQYRLKKLRLNIERYKTFSRENGQHYLSVNIPEFNLYAIKEGTVDMVSGVVVGKKSKQTPIFREKLRYCVLNPKWYIPQSIVKKSIIPNMLKDRGYLKRRKIVVYDGFGANACIIPDPYALPLKQYANNETKNVPYRFVQLANKKSGMGKVKFMFPNRHSVYIHDTIGKWRYKSKKVGLRAVSSGCMRLEKPMTLLEHITKNATNENFTQVKKKVNSQKSGSVSLCKDVFVNTVYLTAYVDKNGAVRYAPDIYGFDKMQTLTYKSK
jgi:murein L,D-transpeptidase YcbB/YkuD